MKKINVLNDRKMEAVTGGFVPKPEPVIDLPAAKLDDKKETENHLIGGADGPTAIF